VSFIPKIRKCPHCGSNNLLRINGANYENKFKILAQWTLMKIFNCRKCKVEVGLFTYGNIKNREKIVWIDLLKCEENYYDHLKKLQLYKSRCNEKNKKYYKTQKEINDIQNKIRLDQIKVKIKAKIENKVMLI
jgi:hypothetical protein|tara:strand:- start:2339 stop:2737 length:399 start_codon:yes stop_codon:yes gene_type:complete